MPGALSLAAPSGVLPNSLSTSFEETQLYPLLSTTYNDGTFERSLITDGINSPRPLRVWQLAKRLTVAQVTALRTFWETTTLGGLTSFYFYPRSADYDASGSNVIGRVTVYFRMPKFLVTTELGRSTVGDIQLVEVA